MTVPAPTARIRLGTAPAIEHVVAVAPSSVDEGVVAVAAAQVIVADPADDDVVARGAIDDVVTTEAEDQVVLGCANQGARGIMVRGCRE